MGVASVVEGVPNGNGRRIAIGATETATGIAIGTVRTRTRTATGITIGVVGEIATRIRTETGRRMTTPIEIKRAGETAVAVEKTRMRKLPVAGKYLQ